MGWLLEARGRASVGQWLGTALLAVGVLTGQLRAPQLLYAAWLENISIGVAATVSIARSGRSSVAVPDWARKQLGQIDLRRGRPARPGPPQPAAPPPWATPTANTPAPPPPTAGPAGAAPPPPPPGARPLHGGPPPHGAAPGQTGPTPDGHVSLAAALLFLLVPLSLFTSFQGQFIAFLANFGGEGGSGGGPVAIALLVVAAAVRAFRRLDPDQALGYAFGHVITLHLGMFFGFFATFAAALSGPDAGGRPSAFELVVTAALLGWFVLTDRLRVGNRPQA